MSSVKIAAKPCKHGTLPDDRLRLFCKTAKPTAVGVSLKSPAMRGFVGGPWALATAAFYLVLLSNGQISGETLRNGTWPGGKIRPQRLSFPSPEQDSPGLSAHRPQTPQRSFQGDVAGTHATLAPNRAHSGSQGETRGLLSPGHSVALCCQRNCHRKNSRRKWMHALWRVSAFFGAAAPLGCAAWTLLFPQPRAFQPCCVCAYSFITGPCRCSGSSRSCCA